MSKVGISICLVARHERWCLTFDSVFGSGDDDVLAIYLLVLNGPCQMLNRNLHGIYYTETFVSKWLSKVACNIRKNLPLRFTTLITSSRMTNAVCKLASSTSVSTALA